MENDLLEKAALAAFEYHGEHLRNNSKELCINHCLRVASLVGDYTDNDKLVAAALLYTIIEEEPFVFSDIEKKFDKKVIILVKELIMKSSTLLKV